MLKKKLEKPSVNTTREVDLSDTLAYLEQEYPELGSTQSFWSFLVDKTDLRNDTTMYLDPWWLVEIAKCEGGEVALWAKTFLDHCVVEDIDNDVLWRVCW